LGVEEAECEGVDWVAMVEEGLGAKVRKLMIWKVLEGCGGRIGRGLREWR
jgi:hypothetical protein